jgi:hypothetical protein
VVVVAGLVVVVLAAAAGIALASGVSFERSVAMQPDRVVAFTKLPKCRSQCIWDHRAESRIVGTFAGHRLVVAPMQNGNFCENFAQAWGGCRARPGFAGKPSLLTNVTVSGSPAIALSGAVVASPEHQLYLTFQDGTSERVPLTYVSRPIDAGFFWVTISKADPAHVPITGLELRSGTKDVEDLYAPTFSSTP